MKAALALHYKYKGYCCYQGKILKFTPMIIAHILQLKQLEYFVKGQAMVLQQFWDLSSQRSGHQHRTSTISSYITTPNAQPHSYSYLCYVLIFHGCLKSLKSEQTLLSWYLRFSRTLTQLKYVMLWMQDCLLRGLC